jgi:hypothetical protein
VVTASCAVLAVLFFAEFVFQPGRMLFGTDMLDQAYQLRDFGVEEVRSGRGLPLWNPFVYGGLPYLAVLPGPAFYPTSLLYLVPPLFRAIGWTFVLHTALAGVLGYAAGRAFRLRRWAAATVGVAFMFTGYVVSHLYGGHDGRMFAMVLIPGVFACAERGLQDDEAGWFLAMGLLVALQIFTPHTQLMYFSSLAVSLYVAWRLGVRALEGAEDRTAALRTGGWFALGFLAAALLGAVQLLPTLGLLDDAVRGAGQGGYEFAASWALPPQELTAFFLPDLVGSLQEHYWGSNSFKLHTEYLGAVTLALASVGFLTPRGDRRVWFLSGATLLGIAFSLGDATPVHRIAYEIVPMIDRFRAPNMMTGPVAFFVALAAGFGVQRVLEAREAGTSDDPDPGGADRQARGGPARGVPIRWPVVWAFAAPFLLLAAWAALSPEGLQRWARNAWYPAGWPRQPSAELAGMLRTTGAVVALLWAGSLVTLQAVERRRLPRWMLGGMLVLLIFDLWRVDARYLETVDPDRVFRADPVVERMRSDLRPGERVWQLENSYGANELMYWDIPSVTGSQNFRLAWYDRLTGGVGHRALLQSPGVWPLLDLRYVTTRSRVQTDLLEEVTRHEGTTLYEVVPDLPHAFFPRRVEGVEGLDEAVRRTRGLGDPTAAAVVRTPATGELPSAGRGTARLETWRPDEVVLNVEAERGGLLFVSEIWHPGWRATVDGEEAPIHRTNAAFRGVEVPEGRHEVRMTYGSTTLWIGGAASVLALLLVLGGMAWRVHRGRMKLDPGAGEAG